MLSNLHIALTLHRLRLCAVFSVCLATLSGCDNAPDTAPQSAATASEQIVDPATASENPNASYVGSASCANCHQTESQQWNGSHHDLAMKPANDDSVIGDFNDSTFNYFGIISRFYRKNGDFYVQTDGPDGKLTEYRISYTFGIYPLQQYLISFPDGRLQALSIAWDARSKAAGGQRWYHLYPNEAITFQDTELHWTGINNNWNFMCADCHSTNLQKNYDHASKSYDTTWAEINVGCEACHGPAANHIRWTEGRFTDNDKKGFSIAFHEHRDNAWIINPETGNAQRRQQKSSDIEINRCASCHSRRLTTSANPIHGEFLDHFQPELLDENLYHVDGQIQGEVYVWGSFLQSKMYHAGVTCSDCHNPHSLQTHLEGNALCAQCHLTTKYDTPDHHFHQPTSTGAQCVNCHMPATTYMGVDDRRDHSFRIPLPGVSMQLGTPNACTKCHTDQTDSWAADALHSTGRRPGDSDVARALSAARKGSPGAEQLLIDLINDTSQSAIARATAVSLLPGYLSQQTVPILQAVAQGDDSLLSYALARELLLIPDQYRPVFAVPLLFDQHTTTRALAAKSLAGLSLSQLPDNVTLQFRQSLASYESSQWFNADRPESLINLASINISRGDLDQAESLYRQAIQLAPYFTPAYVNLADFYYRSGEESQAQATLQTALNIVRDTAPIHHALGLSLIRSGDKVRAIKHLQTAAETKHAPPYYQYVYAVALNSTGDSASAIKVLEHALEQSPGNTDIISALAAFHRDRGESEKSLYYQTMLP